MEIAYPTMSMEDINIFFFIKYPLSQLCTELYSQYNGSNGAIRSLFTLKSDICKHDCFITTAVHRNNNIVKRQHQI